MQLLFDEMFGFKLKSTKGAGVLSSQKDGNGSLLPILGIYWRMPRGWNNRASHIVASATTVLWSRTLWRGKSVWILALSNINLDVFDFDNRTSSIW